MEVLGPLLVYFPGLLMTAIFIISFRKEPRQFRNAIFLLFALMFLLPALAMRRYMVQHRDVPDQAIVLEDKSTTIFENVVSSKRLLDALHPSQPYRCALVTSDYHVFRACEYARTVGLTADGVGSHTRAFYWPTAFIREFIAITKAHWMPYVVIAALWASPIIINLIKALWL